MSTISPKADTSRFSESWTASGSKNTETPTKLDSSTKVIRDLSPRSKIRMKKSQEDIESPGKSSNIIFYKLDKLNIDIFLAFRNSGIPLFNNSFDLYCLMFSIMTTYPIYKGIMDSELRKFWNEMWLPVERDRINALVQKYHESDCPSFEQIANNLTSFSLRTDIVTHLYNLMVKSI